MTFPEALRAHLANTVHLVPIERIFPVYAGPRPAQETLPYQDSIVFSLDNRSSELSDLGGTGPVETTWEITAYSTDYNRLYEISDLLIAGLNYYQGSMPSSGGVTVQSSGMLNCSDDYDLDLRVFLMRHTFEIVYQPA